MKNGSIKNTEFSVSDECTTQERDIISRYWELDNTVFVNKPSIIAKEFNFKTYQIPAIAAKHAIMKLYFDCKSCHNEDVIEVKSQVAYLRNIKKKHNCKSCEEEIKVNERIRRERIQKLRYETELKHKELLTEEINKTLEKGIINESWKLLDNEQFNFLLKICMINNRNKIFSQVFNDDFNRGWQITNSLEKLNLVYIERKRDKSVKDFHFSEELLPILQNNHLNYEPTVENEKRFEWDRLSMRLKKNYSTNEFDPLYSGIATFKEDVVLKAYTKHVYSVWPKENGNIWISITPIEDIVTVTNEPIENEPRHIQEIIKSMFKNPLN
ncbi:hypothetical protein [Joostella sp. CR20]|uniref:hypothetical protein n=1 Tax=Joostella sp. CR20 TaxID=2804312 RepID=UPI00313D9D94